MAEPHRLGTSLLPLLLWMSRSEDAAGTDRARLQIRVVASVVLTAVPTLVFIGALALTGSGEERERAVIKALEILGLRENPHFEHYWVLAWGEESTSATDYVFLSGGHLKYLVNAFFILSPAAIPILIGLGAAAPRRLVASPEARLLSAASACCLVYALALRPLWGPYDWDLFSITATCLVCLAGRMLIENEAVPTRAHLAAMAIGASMLLVTLPFLAVGIAPSKPAGPFTRDALRPSPDEPTWDAFERQLEPWL